MKALITGGSGALGCELLANLQDAVLLSRDQAKTTRKLSVGRSVRWDPAAEPAPLEALQGIEAVFNLAGDRMPEATIGRCYALELTRADQARILLGSPPHGFSLRARLAHRTDSARATRLSARGTS